MPRGFFVRRPGDRLNERDFPNSRSTAIFHDLSSIAAIIMNHQHQHQEPWLPGILRFLQTDHCSYGATDLDTSQVGICIQVRVLWLSDHVRSAFV